MNTDQPTTNQLFEQQYRGVTPYMQNRELSWLTFDERVLDQGADETVPLLERLNFVSIFWSNLQEFFMVRVGSLTDLSLLKTPVIDTKSGLSASEQIKIIHERCHQLYPQQEKVFEDIRAELAKAGVHQLRYEELDASQLSFIKKYSQEFIKPFLSPQIVNSRHPFPHLENGDLYVVVRLEELNLDKKKKKKNKSGGAADATLGLIPMPRQCRRVIEIPGEGTSFILLEEVIEQLAQSVFDMYKVKHTNIICVTRNADLDTTESSDEADTDYREHMKRILKKRGRLAPVRLESAKELSATVKKIILARLSLEEYQTYVTRVPLDLSYTWGISGMLSKEKRANLVNSPFNPAICSRVKPGKSLIKQVSKNDLLLCYPYESMDSFVQLLEEAAIDPDVVSIRITLYRLASVSRLAEALIRAAENDKDVTALLELRARFDESNNIKWSQRFEESGCKVIYGFREFKVHSKICIITRQTDDGIQYITQLGTGNYNEKTARLYTDISYITTDPRFGKDAVRFFRNMALENADDHYKTLWVAPLQIKANILKGIDKEIAKAKKGMPCGLFFKTNSITDKEIIEKIAKASKAGVPTTLFVRGISCIVPGVPGYTDNVRVVSIVGRLLEHSRIYCFGAPDDPKMRLYCSSADLMTRNMDKRVEIAWPLNNDRHRQYIMDYLFASMRDTAKLRELRADGTYTPLGYFGERDENGEVIRYTFDKNGNKTGIALFDSQTFLIELAKLPPSEQKEMVKNLRAQFEEKVAEKNLEVDNEFEPLVDNEFEAVDELEPVVDSEPLVDPEPKTVAESVVELEAETKAEAVVEPEAETKPEPVVESEPEPEPELVVEPEAVIEPEAVSESEPQPDSEPVIELEAELEPEAVVESDPEPESEPEPQLPLLLDTTPKKKSSGSGLAYHIGRGLAKATIKGISSVSKLRNKFRRH